MTEKFRKVSCRESESSLSIHEELTSRLITNSSINRFKPWADGQP